MEKSISFPSLKASPPFETLIRLSQFSSRRIWISSSLRDAFFKAQITSICQKKRIITVLIDPIPQLTSSELTKLGSENVEFILESPDPPNVETCSDMVNMDCLNEAELLQNLGRRYWENLVYTYIGPTLLFVNPYQPVKDLYSERQVENYVRLSKKELFELGDADPHVFAVAAKSFNQMIKNKKNQAIVISGESGAGKTENTKYAMKFLTGISGKEEKKEKLEFSIEEKILSSNPILEAFGNAKTLRNDNSSRFGKYMKILVDPVSLKISGAEITNYLLEKSRVTFQASEERNYHIFYHLLKGNDIERLSRLGLASNNQALPIKNFQYLNQSGCYEVNGIDDHGLYSDVCQAFKKMKFDQDEENAVWNYLAAILHLGNLTFDETDFNKSGVSQPCTVNQQDSLKLICDLLAINQQTFISSLVSKTVVVAKEVIIKHIDKNGCQTLRNSLCKRLYEKLFNWLVNRINMSNQDQKLKSIGLLDIFGFEKFEVNSLEQICINYTNEKLHQLYIEYVFKAEQKELKDQKLDDLANRLILPEDNIHVIKTIETVFNPIDEASDNNPNAQNKLDGAILKEIVEAMNKEIKINQKCKEAWQFNQNKKEWFTIIHTADRVDYWIKDFKNKNQDFFSEELENVFINTKSKNVKSIYEDIVDKSNQNVQGKPNAKKLTLFKKFKNQMTNLMVVLQSCDVSFIRCLKSNLLKEKENFQGIYVLQQIKYLGVLESINIRKYGFPFRKDFSSFFQQYFELNIEFDKKVELQNIKSYTQDVFKKKCWRIMRNIIFDEKDPKDKDFKEKVLFGLTKIYTKQEIATYLDKLLLDQDRKKILEVKLAKLHNYKAVRVQSFCKMVVPRKKYVYKKGIVKNLNKTFARNWTERTAEYVRILRNINNFYKKWRKVEKKMLKFKHKCFLRYKQKAKLKTKFLKKRQSTILLNQFWETKMIKRFISKMTFHVNILKNLEQFSSSIEKFHFLYKKKLNSFFLKSFFFLLFDRQALIEKHLQARRKLHAIFLNKLNSYFIAFKKNIFMKEENIIKKPVRPKKNLKELVKKEIDNKKFQIRCKAMENKLLNWLNRKNLKSAMQIIILANQEFEDLLRKNNPSYPPPPNLVEITNLSTKLCGKLNLSLKQIKHEKYLFSVGLLKKKTMELFALDSKLTVIQKITYNNENNEFQTEETKQNIEEDSIDRKGEFDFVYKREKEIIKSKKQLKSDSKSYKQQKPLLKKIKEDFKRFCGGDKATAKISIIKNSNKICFAASQNTYAQEEILIQIVNVFEEYFKKSLKKKIISFFNYDSKNEEDLLFSKLLILLIVFTTYFPFPKTFNDAIIFFIGKMLTETKKTEEEKEMACYVAKRIDRNLNMKPRSSIFISDEEIYQAVEMKKLKVEIKFFKTKSHEMQIETFNTVKEVLDQAAEHLEIISLVKYLGIYLDYGNGIMLEDDHIFYDQWTYYNRKLKDEKEKAKLEGNDRKVSIFLRIKLFPLTIASFNPDFLCLLYNQMLHNYLTGKLQVESDQTIYELSSYAYFIENGKAFEDEDIQKYFPSYYSRQDTDAIMKKKLMSKYDDIINKSMTKKEALGCFVSMLREKEYESNHKFDGNFIQITIDNTGKILKEMLLIDYQLIVNDHELIILNKRKIAKKNRKICAFKNILSYGCQVQENEKRFIWRGYGKHQYLYFFESQRCDQIMKLLEGYLKLLKRRKK